MRKSFAPAGASPAGAGAHFPLNRRTASWPGVRALFPLIDYPAVHSTIAIASSLVESRLEKPCPDRHGPWPGSCRNGPLRRPAHTACSWRPSAWAGRWPRLACALARPATPPRPRAGLFEPLQEQVLRARWVLLRHLAGPGRRLGHVHDHVPEPVSRAVDLPASRCGRQEPAWRASRPTSNAARRGSA